MKKSKILIPLNISLVVLALFLFYSNCAESPNKQTQSSNGISCTPQSGALGNPQTIEEAVNLINLLPKPLSIDCFLASLARPINLFATNSQSSVQPSISPRSPRIFITTGSLIISTVPEGPDSQLIEFSQLQSSTRSLKAELAFPIMENISKELPFTRVVSGSGTRCDSCHAVEVRDFSINYTAAFVSNVVRPDPFFNVNLDSVYQEALKCDPAKELWRCEILKAIFLKGPYQLKYY